ncbi:hypothetical protein ACQ86O_01080 [Serratia sp. L9]|uniref:hypothetical protein n=1 Tax=Serratia sp. L9 TaxID=3423946 RepID=UPI003D675E89
MQISAVCTGGTCYVVMAQDFTSFGHWNTVFREKNRHVICITVCKRLAAADHPPSFKLLSEGKLDISWLIYHALGWINGGEGDFPPVWYDYYIKGTNRGLTLTAVQGIIRRFPLF